MAKANTAAVIEEAVSNSYWREELARDLLDAQAASGMSLEAFSKRHGLMPERLRRWKRKLKPQAGNATDLRFLPVHVVEAQPSEEPAQSPSRIELVAGGRVVHVRPGFCEVTLLRLVRLLESAQC